MGRGHVSHTVKMLFFFKFYHSLLHVHIDQTNYSNDDQVNVYENSKFHEPQVRVVALGCGHTGDV